MPTHVHSNGTPLNAHRSATSGRLMPDLVLNLSTLRTVHQYKTHWKDLDYLSQLHHPLTHREYIGAQLNIVFPVA